MTCLKMGSDESHFNVSVGSDGQSHKTVSTNHNLFEKKGEPKRYISNRGPFAYQPLGQTGLRNLHCGALSTPRSRDEAFYDIKVCVGGFKNIF